MHAIRRSPFTRFFIVPLTFVALLSGCYKWSTPSQSPVDFIRDKEPSKVRLTLTEDRVVVVKHPAVTDSTISASEGDLLVVIPLDEVVQLEWRRFDVLTSVLIPVTILVPLGVAAAVALTTNPIGW